jgi:hypothetical protein
MIRKKMMMMIVTVIVIIIVIGSHSLVRIKAKTFGLKKKGKTLTYLGPRMPWDT